MKLECREFVCGYRGLKEQCVVLEIIHTPHRGQFCFRPPPPGISILGGCLLFDPPPLRISVAPPWGYGYFLE